MDTGITPDDPIKLGDIHPMNKSCSKVVKAS